MTALESWLLGEPGLLPFAGHFRLQARGRRACVSVAGRVAASAGPARAHVHARAVAGVLSTAADGPWADTDRHGLIRRIWQLLDDVDDKTLGPERGTDLSLLLLAQDASGTGVAGSNSGVWVQVETWRSSSRLGILSAPPGRPARLPGVLTLEQPCTRVVGSPTHLDPVLPAADRLAQRCGVRTSGGAA